MGLDTNQLIQAVQNGIPISKHSYAQLAEQLDCTEREVIEGIEQLKQDEQLRRFGVVVKHRNLGYQANAMVVWDIDDELVNSTGEKLAAEPAVTLCYQRPRNLPHWPYNLFTMLHGTKRDLVLNQLAEIRKRLNLTGDYDVLFSTKCFKQRGAHYF